MCQTTDQRLERKKLGKLTFENFVFSKSVLCFEHKKHGLSAKQQVIFLKTVAYVCKWEFSDFYLQAKRFARKFSVIERKHRISSENVFLRVFKGAVQVSSATFEKMMIKSTLLFVAGLGLCVFLYPDRKVSQVVKSTN